MRVQTLFFASMALFFATAATAVPPCSDFSGQYQCTNFDLNPSYKMTIQQTVNSDNAPVFEVVTKKNTPKKEFILDEKVHSSHTGKCSGRMFQVVHLPSENSLSVGTTFLRSVQGGDLRVDALLFHESKDGWGDPEFMPIQHLFTAFCKKIP